MRPMPKALLSGRGDADQCALAFHALSRWADPSCIDLAGNNNLYHTNCFRCSTCQCKLTLSAYREDAVTKRLYCNPHYNQLAAAAGLDKVAKGGVDASAGILVETKEAEAELEEEDRIKAGAAVWVSVDDLPEATRKQVGTTAAAEPYVRATVITVHEGGQLSMRLAGGTQLTAPKKAASVCSPDGSNVPDNLGLRHLTEANLLDNLRQRFNTNAIYTWTGCGHAHARTCARACARHLHLPLARATCRCCMHSLHLPSAYTRRQARFARLAVHSPRAAGRQPL